MKRRAFAIFALIIAALCLQSCSSSTAKEETETEGLPAAVNPWEDNQIPVLYLSLEEDEFEKVNASEDHSYRAQGGTVRLEVPDGYTGEYSSEPAASSEEMALDYFRGRGHGTWSADKKPYTFKLQEKADLLGMGSSKRWVLLANRYDESQLRNRLISYIGKRLGSFYSVQSQPVDLVVNDEYYGSYLLSEQVAIGENRIEIDELTEEDIKEPELTGGYLLYMCPLYDEPVNNWMTTDRMIRFGNEDPQFTDDEKGTKEQKEYITDYLQKTENAIYGQNFCDENGVSYADYMDIRSAADYWWVQEFSGNTDAFITKSTYLYKERNGKLCWGPLWDFDLALGGGADTVDGFLHRNMPWLDYLRAYNPEYQAMLKERWTLFDSILDEILKPGGILDQYAEEIRASWQDDADRWPVIGEDGQVYTFVFDDTVKSLRDWMTQRQKWINENIDQDLTYVYNTVSFVADGQVIKTAPVLRNLWLDQLPPAPVKAGYVFAGWETEEHELYEGQSFEKDSQLTALYVPEAEAVMATDLLFDDSEEIREDIHQKKFSMSYTLVPENAADKNVHWESSDPDIAVVDEYGNVILKAVGNVTITAALDSGVSGSYELHIYDSLK